MLALDVFPALCVLFGWATYPIAGIALAVVGVVPMMAVTVRINRVASQGAILAGAVLGFLGGMMAIQWVDVRLGRRVDGIPVAQAAQHPDASVFRFTDGVVRADLRGQHGVRGRRSATTVFHEVAPLVAPDWTPRAPVTAWVACNTTHENTCVESWQRPLRGGVRIDWMVGSTCEQARRDALARHGLMSAADAPILEWTAAPEDAVDPVVWVLVVLSALAHAAWLAVTLWSWRRALRRGGSSP